MTVAIVSGVLPQWLAHSVVKIAGRVTEHKTRKTIPVEFHKSRFRSSWSLAGLSNGRAIVYCQMPKRIKRGFEAREWLLRLIQVVAHEMQHEYDGHDGKVFRRKLHGHPMPHPARPQERRAKAIEMRVAALLVSDIKERRYFDRLARMLIRKCRAG